MSDSNNVYQVNFHEGDGWQIIDEAAIKARVGTSWDYMVWRFDQGETASVRHVEYRRVAARPTQLTVKVNRKGHLYFYSRFRGEVPDVAGQPITRDRAMMLVENNPGGEGVADFSSDPREWEYTAVIRLEEKVVA